MDRSSFGAMIFDPPMYFECRFASRGSEFTYAAPAEFSSTPPWWLLLDRPEYWSEGMEAWTGDYEDRLRTFLKVLSEREEELIRRGMEKEIEAA